LNNVGILPGDVETSSDCWLTLVVIDCWVESIPISHI
jgi:hypothetical protein